MTAAEHNPGSALSLVAYQMLSDHGFALPLFASSPSANALHIAVPSRPADPDAVIAGFQLYDADVTTRLDEGGRRSGIAVGATWLDVFLWADAVYVGTRSEIWESVSGIKDELERSAPLSLLALADGARASNLSDIAAVAYRWLARDWGDAFAARWQIDTYLKSLALRGLRRRLDSMSKQHSFESAIHNVQLVRHHSIVELRLPPPLWRMAQIDVDHLPDLVAASFGFGLAVNIVRQAGNLDDFYEQSERPAILLMRVRRGRGNTQTQIPFQAVDAFFGKDLVVRSGRSDKTRSMTLSRTKGRRNTMKLQIPEMAQIPDPVVRFERTPDGVTYYVHDTSSSEGKVILQLLEAGLLDGSTLRSRGKATWWRVLSRLDQN